MNVTQRGVWPFFISVDKKQHSATVRCAACNSPAARQLCVGGAKWLIQYTNKNKIIICSLTCYRWHKLKPLYKKQYHTLGHAVVLNTRASPQPHSLEWYCLSSNRFYEWKHFYKLSYSPLLLFWLFFWFQRTDTAPPKENTHLACSKCYYLGIWHIVYCHFVVWRTCLSIVSFWCWYSVKLKLCGRAQGGDNSCRNIPKWCIPEVLKQPHRRKITF